MHGRFYYYFLIQSFFNQKKKGICHLFEEKLKGLDGILVAPGFGERGLEGKINAVKFARENNVPFFGICLGMQCAVIEFARNVLHLQEASSAEMNPETPNPVIDIMEGQKSVTNKGERCD